MPNANIKYAHLSLEDCIACLDAYTTRYTIQKTEEIILITATSINDGAIIQRRCPITSGDVIRAKKRAIDAVVFELSGSFIFPQEGALSDIDPDALSNFAETPPPHANLLSVIKTTR